MVGEREERVGKKRVVREARGKKREGAGGEGKGRLKGGVCEKGHPILTSFLELPTYYQKYTREWDAAEGKKKEKREWEIGGDNRQ